MRAALAVLGLAAGSFVATTVPAHASAPVILSGSQWFGGSGVNVCSSSTDPYCGSEYHVGGWNQDWWQCVELAQRFYKAKGWYSGIFVGVTYAYQIYDNAAGLGMTRQANGSISSIVPGDMIIHGSGLAGSGNAGHVAIVDSVNGSTINIVEQNWSVTGRAVYTLSGGSLSRSGAGSILGVVHDSDNTSTGGGTTPPPDADADGVVDSQDQCPTVYGSPFSQGCPSRVIARQGSTLQGKDTLYDNWSGLIGTSSTKFQSAGDRIGFIDTSGVLYVKEGLYGSWNALASGVDDFILTPTRVVMRQGNALQAKDAFYDNWVGLIGTSSAKFQAAGSRIGFVDTSGELYVKEGLYGNWIALAGGVDDFILTPNRVIIRQGSVLSAKDNLYDNWSGLIGTSSTKFHASGNRIGFIDTNEVLYVKEGLSGGWVALASGVDDFTLTPTRVVMRQGPALSAKDNLYDNWTGLIGASSTKFQAAGNRIGFVDTGGELYVKEGLYGSWNALAAVDDFRLT